MLEKVKNKLNFFNIETIFVKLYIQLVFAMLPRPKMRLVQSSSLLFTHYIIVILIKLLGAVKNIFLINVDGDISKCKNKKSE